MISSERHGFIERTRPLLFILRSKKPEPETFMASVVETVLPREVRKLASAIEEKDAVLQHRDNHIQAIQYENVGLQGEIRVKDQQIRRFEDTVIHPRERYVNHARDFGKGNIIIIVRKDTRPANNKYHDMPYYVSSIEQCKKCVKLRWLN